MSRIFIKGNEAVIKGAILAGCRAFYGYPITPASEIAETAARFFPQSGRTFLQAESEIASINMVYGAASAGQRVMTASSSPGISLKQEGISYAAGSELPLVVVDVMRGGPGLGNIAPEQSDYNQMVKGGGHGNYKLIALAPNCTQEMCDLTMLAFELADKYRNPVVVLADGFVGQMMEPLELPEPVPNLPKKPWAVDGTAETYQNLITSIYMDPTELEEHNRKLQEKYSRIAEAEVRYEEFETEDAEVVMIGYGIVARVLQTVVDDARSKDLPVGLLRPITLWPFPKQRIQELADTTKLFYVVELSNGQMVDDVRLALDGKRPTKFYGRMGGAVPTTQEILDEVSKTFQELRN
ncbi:3-methyl-2-oxobutanoate dehydrogenase subunit VorB [candidate division KSB1 bacterium]|nr:3-methyl-2-oxobutanoate dehydrogenase subunit VorB [candidate division KSB1 bacterium]NIR72783.1 3-methyl-2-oxobutanoate dehydrogenase subunit VorB [candidate division KSB1 bacterium]NIS23739.1 3-methyl-2-oxobutanoate dehydrogenase subunit VorB [candidate division KSB1 bacterium]NIT70660.1 3-methyl-2-oxobutanoate dehydrogenase subunit VorB [candidate division KSB1 bacterium]NIU24387.1 3-methyl-2-oxobutanoate dehydrogenase subunit VorB [candidate division KSB1 bacterium]